MICDEYEKQLAKVERWSHVPGSNPGRGRFTSFHFSLPKYQNCSQLTPERVPKYQKCPQLTPEGVRKYQNCRQLTPEGCYKRPKRPKLITQKSVINFRNLLQCPRNTQALT